MSKFDSILESMKKENFPAKRQLLEYTLRIVQNMQRSKKELDQADKRAILEFCYGEVDTYLAAIPAAATYQEKDLIFECEELVLGLIMHLCQTPGEIPQNVLVKIKALAAIVKQERYLETAIDDLFQREAIREPEVKCLLILADRTADEYHKGKLYAGLAHYKDQIAKFSDGAKACVTAYLIGEISRCQNQAPLTEDQIHNLELAADVSKYFADDALISLLGKVMELGHSNVNYYAVETLLSLGQPVPADRIASLARDLEYADLTYGMLVRFGKQALFPKECATEAYLAKSDLVHWLTYPTELGKAPDQIEYIGKITYLFRKEVYFVFKFRSDSETLGEHLRNKWLIGWSSKDGGTFSHFEEYALFERETISATLKNIKKKIIG